MIFTGDFIYLADIVRPDLLQKAAEIIGTQEYRIGNIRSILHNYRNFQQKPSLNQKINDGFFLSKFFKN